MRIISYLFLFIIILLGVTFATLNSQVVILNYYIGHHPLPLSLLLVSVFAIGCLLGVLVTVWLLIKTKIQNRHLRKKLKLVEKEVENLRAIPLRDQH